jgi:hypothetical protein
MFGGVDRLDERPSRQARYFSWIIIAAISFFFAEIISGASMITSFAPGAVIFQVVWSLLITIPLYGLHTLVLAWLVGRFGKLRLYTLFLAGAIFGLYEAYITKMIWLPTWAGDPYFAGVSVIGTLVLVLWWHPLMSFFVPLFVSEGVLARSREMLAGLPGPLRGLFSTKKRAYAAIFAFLAFCGFFQGMVSPSPVFSIFNTLAVGLVIAFLLHEYRRRGYQRYEFRQLLPAGKEVVVLIVLLLAVYLFGIVFIRPEALPGVGSQLTVWLLYAFFAILLAFSLRKSAKVVLPRREFPLRFSWGKYGAVLVIIASLSALFSLLPPARLYLALLCWFAGIGLGFVLLALAAHDALKK